MLSQQACQPSLHELQLPERVRGRSSGLSEACLRRSDETMLQGVRLNSKDSHFRLHKVWRTGAVGRRPEARLNSSELLSLLQPHGKGLAPPDAALRTS